MLAIMEKGNEEGSTVSNRLISPFICIAALCSLYETTLLFFFLVVLPDRTAVSLSHMFLFHNATRGNIIGRYQGNRRCAPPPFDE